MDSSPWDNAHDDYNARLCDYARACNREDASMVLLPLVMCRGMTIAAGDGDGSGNNPRCRCRRRVRDAAKWTLVFLILPPTLFAYFTLLFRLLATTAESRFGVRFPPK
jgi:hypothetical protein